MLKTFIGAKIIKAEPMSKTCFDFAYKSKREAEPNSEDIDGYHVVYPNPDGSEYDSWSPSDVFEKAYRELTEPEKEFSTDKRKEILKGKRLLIATAIAMACHNANKAICEFNGDYSLKPWHEADARQRESALYGVLYKLDNKDVGPKEQHEEWVRAKEADGWKYGKVKDAQKKEHPCMVDYEKLPDSQKLIDAVFVGIVEAVSEKLL